MWFVNKKQPTPGLKSLEKPEVADAYESDRPFFVFPEYQVAIHIMPSVGRMGQLHQNAHSVGQIQEAIDGKSLFFITLNYSLISKIPTPVAILWTTMTWSSFGRPC